MQQQSASIFNFWQSALSNLFEIIVSIFLLLILILAVFKLISENALIYSVIFGIAVLLTKWLVVGYLNFVLAVRGNDGIMRDNRAVHFLTFDAQKFLLIVFALVIVLLLGLNKVLNNETIATLLGGLIGSLLTMKGSFQDLKFTREEREAINRVTDKNN